MWNTALLIGWDEPGGTYDHVPPPSVPPPDPAGPAGEYGFRFDRSGYRVPAIIVSPWVAEGDVFNQEHRHTSLIATLREQWNLGDAFTGRDAAARTLLPRLHPRRATGPQVLAGANSTPGASVHEEQLALGKACPAGQNLSDGTSRARSREQHQARRTARRSQRPTSLPSRS